MEISEDNLYIGDIYMVIKFEQKKLNDFITKGGIPCDLGCACEIVLAKKDAVFLKVGYNKYIDKDYLDKLNDFDIINEYLEKRIYDNIILRHGNYGTKVGQLFIYNLVKYDSKKLIK